MTDSVEVKGKTVKEAVSEGLLQMGARENEVKVTVLEQPKAGLFGFLGGKQAKVLIEKKAPRGRGARRSKPNDEHAGHAFAKPADSDNRRGRPQRRKPGAQSSAKTENKEKRSAVSQKEKGDDQSGSSTQRRRGNRGRSGSLAKGGQQDGRPGKGNKEQATSGNNNQESKGGRKTRTAPQAKRSVSNENRSGRNMNRNRYQHNDGEMVLDKNNPHLDEQRKHFEAAERVRKNEERLESNERNIEGSGREKQTSRGSSGGGARGGRRTEQRNDHRSSGRNSRNANDRSRRNENESAPRVRQEPQVPDELIIAGIKGTKYAEAMRDIPVEEANATLEKVAAELFTRSGFPCSCEVQEDEYSLVKIVTDDASAGMLIGRHGSTVDAIEHLVERMSCNAVGERVRMNLDINNYRRRREEALIERVGDAVKSVLSSGKPYHIEPQDARERRMVHLEELKTEGLRTYTMYGSGGKHVVIAIDDKPKETITEEASSESEKPVVDEFDSNSDHSESAAESNEDFAGGDESNGNPAS